MVLRFSLLALRLLEQFIKNKQPDIRRLSDMREAIFDQKWLKNAPNLELYYMYRGAARNQADAAKIKQAGLRYDITVIPAKMLGREFVKTAGHDHTCVPDQKCTFTEIYEVISGQAVYLMQKLREVPTGDPMLRTGDPTLVGDKQLKTAKIQDVYAVQAQPGDKVIIPPNYGHVTINAAKTDLVLANWLADCFKSDYTLFRQMHGACYYALLPCRDALQCVSTTTSLRGGVMNAMSHDDAAIPTHKQLTWQLNKNYDQVPELRFSQPTNFPELGLDKNKPMYDLISDFSKLDFLKRPQDFADLWQKIKSL